MKSGLSGGHVSKRDLIEMDLEKEGKMVYDICQEVKNQVIEHSVDHKDVLEWINIGFNIDKTCEVYTGPSNLSEPIPTGEWAINTCENRLIFFNPNQGYSSYIYPEVLPFGSQKIIELSWNVFICEDLSGNILRWERI